MDRPLSMFPYFGSIKHTTPFCSLGPKDLTSGTLFPHSKSSIWTVQDNLFRQGVIQQNLLAVSFDPTTSDTVTGELTFGSTDSTRYTGNINYV
jgi:cathepsin E